MQDPRAHLSGHFTQGQNRLAHPLAPITGAL